MAVPAVSAFPKPLELPNPKHQPVVPPATWQDVTKRKLWRVIPPVDGLFLPQVHSNSTGNEIVSASNRVLGTCPQPEPAAIRRLHRLMTGVATRLPAVLPLTTEQALATFKGAKYKLYERAYRSLQVSPLSRKDASIKAFIKSEKFDWTAKVNPDPRMIQCRGERFNLHMACYTKPLEKALYALRDYTGTEVFAKCANSYKKAALIKAKFEAVPGCVAFSLDASRFDKHISLELLRVEHGFYKKMYGRDPMLATLCRWQEKNRVRTSTGVRYGVCGGRMSGDMNTALGNCAIMYGMLLDACQQLDVLPAVLDDGDDCIIFIPASVADLARRELPRIFLGYGQEIKLENEARCVSDVLFCQSRPLVVSGSLKMVRNWKAVLSKGTSGVKHWNNPRLVRPMCTTVGACELACNRGVPILQEYALALLRMGQGEQLRQIDYYEGYLWRAKLEVGSLANALLVTPTPVTADDRIEFSRVFGVSVDHQLAIEETLRQWEFGTHAENMPPELDSRWRPNFAPGVWVPRQ